MASDKQSLGRATRGLGDAMGAGTMGDLTIERDIEGFGSARNVRASSDHVSLVFATDFGPRVLGFGPRRGGNVFGYVPPEEEGADTGAWRIRGGHRLWIAPEDRTRTYAPDNAPITWRTTGDGVVLGAGLDAAGFEKELAITIDPAAPRVRIEHRITNHGGVTALAPWALSLMQQRGVAIVPSSTFVPHPEGLLPSRPLVLWPYTWLGDPRLTWGKSLVRVAQTPERAEPLKLGAFVEQGIAAYAVGGDLFVKRFPTGKGTYPDMGCNFEVFTDGRILELESLGPLVTLGRGETVRHVEVWSVFRDVSISIEDAEAAPTLARLDDLHTRRAQHAIARQ